MSLFFLSTKSRSLRIRRRAKPEAACPAQQNLHIHDQIVGTRWYPSIGHRFNFARHARECAYRTGQRTLVGSAAATTRQRILCGVHPRRSRGGLQEYAQQDHHVLSKVSGRKLDLSTLFCQNPQKKHLNHYNFSEFINLTCLILNITSCTCKWVCNGIFEKIKS